MDPILKPSRRKRLLQNLALFLGVFFLCGVLAEIVLRLAGYGNLEIYQPDPKLYWRLKPNQDCFTKIDRKPVHINSHGTRGPVFVPEKPAGTYRILSLGDSRTFGWGLSQAETYSDLFGRLVQSHLGAGTNVEVINAGVNAWSYSQMLVFYRDTAAAWQPDLVILGEANLWTQFSEQNDPQFVRRFLRQVRMKNLLRRSALYHYVVEVKLKAVYERHRERFIPVNPQQDELFKSQQQSDPDAFFRGAIAGVCAVARTNNAQPILLWLPWFTDLNSTNESQAWRAKRAVATELHIPLVDPTSVLASNAASLYLEGDPVHLNAAGNERVAKYLFERFREEQQPPVGPTPPAR